MYRFTLILAVSPSLKQIVLIYARLRRDEKRLCKNTNPPTMPDDPCFSHPQQQTNKTHVADYVGPFYNISLPHETDPHSSYAIEIGAPSFDRDGSATSVMTPILASTRSTFFQQYEFDFNPCATLHTELRRLAKLRKWKQGSNSKVLRRPRTNVSD